MRTHGKNSQPLADRDRPAAKATAYALVGGADVRVTDLGETTFKKLIESGDYNQHLESNLPADENKWIDASSLTEIRHSDLKVAFASSNFD